MNPSHPELFILAPKHECADDFRPWQVARSAHRCATDTPFNLWIEEALDAGLLFPFDDEQRLPRDLPPRLDDFKCVMIDPARAGEFKDGPNAAALKKFRDGGGYVFIPPAGDRAPNSIQAEIQRVILTASLRPRHPDMLARLRAVPDEKLVAWWRRSLADQARVLMDEDAGWAWGDPVAYHIFWPAEAAAEHFQDPSLMDIVWDCARAGLDLKRWPHPLCCGKRFALKYAERFGDKAVLRRCIEEGRQVLLATAEGSLWQMDGVCLNADLRVGPDVDHKNPPPKIRENAWVWCESVGNMGDTLGYVSKASGDPSHAELAVRQTLAVHRWNFDRSIGLWYHVGRPSGPEKRSAPWGRGNGWMLYGIRGLLEDLPDGHPSRPELVQALRDGLEGLVRWQGPNGLWHNVLDTTGADSREESCTSWMFTATYARAYWKGWLRDPRIPPMCEKAWQGLKTRLWRGLPVGHCAGTPYMASRQCYLSWPHSKFMAGGALLAWIEIERLRRALS